MPLPIHTINQLAGLENYQKLDIRYSLKLSILPIGLALLAWVPGYFTLSEIVSLAGISIDSPIREMPHPEVWLNLVCLVFSVFFVLGAIIGHFLNGLVLLIFYRWEKNDVASMLMHFKYPDHWLRPPQEQVRADSLQAKARRKGKRHFIVTYGVVGIGATANLFLIVLPVLASDSSLRFDLLFMFACIWFSLGALYGWILWKSLIGNY